MKNVRKMLIYIMIIVMTFLSIINVKATVFATTNSNIHHRKTNNIAILFANLNEPFFILVKENLQDIENQNKDKVNFTFFDLQHNEAIQNELINSQLKSKIHLLAIFPVISSGKLIIKLTDCQKLKI